MAIEDGFCLAECIHAADGDFAVAFPGFQTLRLKRTTRVQLESRAIWEDVLHVEGTARTARNATVTPDLVPKCSRHCSSVGYSETQQPGGAVKALGHRCASG